MMVGSIGQWAEVFTRVPQLGGQQYPTAPNFSQQVAVYIVDTGQNAGARDGPVSILWLKAFGARAIAVPGPQSPEYWHLVADPRKFEGVLPVLWRERDTTIYLVSDGPFSLAHVLRPDDLVRHTPINGLDVGEIRRYVAKLGRNYVRARGIELGRRQQSCDSGPAPARPGGLGANHVQPRLACARERRGARHSARRHRSYGDRPRLHRRMQDCFGL